MAIMLLAVLAAAVLDAPGEFSYFQSRMQVSVRVPAY